MSDLPGDLLYTNDHEWLRREDDGSVTIGITEHAASALGDITEHAASALGDMVYVELPEVGLDVDAAGEMAVVESVKAASDVYAPIGGSIVAVNEELADEPEKINSDPYGDGWIVRMQPTDAIDESAMMSPDDYQTFLDELDD